MVQNDLSYHADVSLANGLSSERELGLADVPGVCTLVSALFWHKAIVAASANV